MLAAVGGLAYTLSALLRVQSYLGYLLPLPVVVAAMRGGAAAGRRTMSATAFLLLGAPASCCRTQHMSTCSSTKKAQPSVLRVVAMESTRSAESLGLQKTWSQVDRRVRTVRASRTRISHAAQPPLLLTKLRASRAAREGNWQHKELPGKSFLSRHRDSMCRGCLALLPGRRMLISKQLSAG